MSRNTPPQTPEDGFDGPTTQPQMPWPRIQTPRPARPHEVPLDEMVSLLRHSLGPENNARGDFQEGPLVVSSHPPEHASRARRDSPWQGVPVVVKSTPPEARTTAPNRLVLPPPDTDNTLAVPPVATLPRAPRVPSRSSADLYVSELMATPGIGERRIAPQIVATTLALAAVAALLAAVYMLA